MKVVLFLMVDPTPSPHLLPAVPIETRTDERRRDRTNTYGFDGRRSKHSTHMTADAQTWGVSVSNSNPVSGEKSIVFVIDWHFPSNVAGSRSFFKFPLFTLSPPEMHSWKDPSDTDSDDSQSQSITRVIVMMLYWYCRMIAAYKTSMEQAD